MEILGKLFGSASKVKIMRLFLFNQGAAFDKEDIVQKANVSPESVRKIVGMLEKIGFLKKKTFVKVISHDEEEEDLEEKSGKKKKKKTRGWVLNPNFKYISSLGKLLINTKPYSHKDILSKLKSVGPIKLIIISGVFIQEWDSRVDILIVGDRLHKGAIAKAVRTMESEIGKELRYTMLTTEEFNYRLDIYDKLIRYLRLSARDSSR